MRFARSLALTVFITFSAFAAKPNILFIAVDDLRPELGCYGTAHIKSPNIDRLAARGLLFEQAYCQQAVCSPSRTSLMTGLRPDSTKVYDLNTHFRTHVPNVVTLGQHFKTNGYDVIGMGKIYHGGLNDDPTWTEYQPVKNVKSYADPESLKLISRKNAIAKEKGLKGKALSRAARGPVIEAGDVPDTYYHDGAVAEMGIKTLEQYAGKDKPFFLAVGFLKPHLPFVAPKKYWDLYDPAKIELASNPNRTKNAPEWANTTWGEMRVYEGVPAKGNVSDELARQLRHGYYACVSYTDANVGKLLDALDRLKLTDNTIVILWGDHGWHLGEHSEWCKHTNFELDARVPMIIAAPGTKAIGKRTKALSEFVDIYPTLCDLAGLSKPDHLEGTSAAPLFDNSDRPWKTAAFSQYPRSKMMGYSMKTDRYRLTRWLANGNPDTVLGVELYDHQKDPAEDVNVASDPAYADTLKQLTEQAKAGWQGTKTSLKP